jgi:dihydroorotase
MVFGEPASRLESTTGTEIMRFDLLLKGGEVVDPGASYRGKLDVAIKRNRIAAVDADIPADSAFRVVDASGQYVTPGLVDLHTHVYHGATFWGIHADPVAARSGVTTWLDVGSAGGYNFPGFREFIARPSTARIYALLNISSIGLTAPTFEL